MFYDLGLAEEQLATVRSWCGISIRDGANFTSHGELKQVREQGNRLSLMRNAPCLMASVAHLW